MSALRESARRVLGDDAPASVVLVDPPRAGKARTTDRFSVAPPAGEVAVERVSIDVRIEGRVEQVTLVLRDGTLTWTCTDGTAGREGSGVPLSPWVRAALRWMAQDGPLDASRPVEPPRSLRPPAPESAPLPDALQRGQQLADALDDVVVAVVRAGTEGRDSPTVREAIDRVARVASPLGLALSRWIGRLERAMAAGDARTVARLLHGAARAGDDLRGAHVGTMARARAATWLGDLARLDLERVVDRPMLEIARELLDGVQRSAIERRYLVDLTTGEVLCEERARTEPAPSLGPCPRSLFVGLAEIESGPAPRRIRILQYTVTLELTTAELEKVLAHALRRTSMLLDAYRVAVAASPALAEPVALVACAGVEDGLLVDAVGDPIPISRAEDPGAADTLAELAREPEALGTPAWIAGRLVDVEGAVRIVPCAVGNVERVVRLR